MKNYSSGKVIFTGALLITLCIGSTGFSQKKSDETLQKGSVKLEYNYPSDKAIKYVNTNKIVQDMDVNGQSMLVNVTSYFGCNVRLTGKQGENLNLEIRIDTMAQNIDTPQGAVGGSVNEIKGKVFNMIITPNGKAIDLSDAAKIVYNIEGMGESNVSQSFLNYFPVLPTELIKTGDTWITRDTINSKTQSMSMWMPVESNNKFEGIEKINGIDCAKISATLSGSRKLTTQTQGMIVNTSGTFTGTQILLFALKEGYFIKETVTTRMTGNIEMPDQNMSFPLIMDMTEVNEMK